MILAFDSTAVVDVGELMAQHDVAVCKDKTGGL